MTPHKRKMLQEASATRASVGIRARFLRKVARLAQRMPIASSSVSVFLLRIHPVFMVRVRTTNKAPKAEPCRKEWKCS
jgi:hypothetical protein